MKSPLRWLGGKRLLAATIVGHIGEHSAYVETCCGGASVFWAKDKGSSKSEVLNDADGELINFYYVLHKQGRRLAREVDAMPYSRALFAQVKADSPRSAFGRARRFWYLNRVGFGGRRRGATFGVQCSRRAAVLPENLLAGLDAVVERMRGVLFESIDLVRLIELYDRRDTIFYVDPPYLGLSQDYACQFADGDHARLAAALRRVKGVWLLSYNDCPEVRRLYAGCHSLPLTTRYTIGANSSSASGSDSTRARELLISNRPLMQMTDK